MSRHRIVRTMDYKDEYDEYDDVYGHSVDDDNCISPTDSSQWIYDRARGQQSISAFIANHRNIEEENEEEEDSVDAYGKTRRDSENFQMPVLDDLEKAKLMSCIDEIRSVVGDSVSEKQIVETAMLFNYDVPKALDAILNSASTHQPEKSSIKTLKEPPVEKDSKSNLFKIVNSDKNGLTTTFKIPVLNLTESCNKSNNSRLNELIKSNLQNCKFGESPSKSGFVLPKLNMSPSNDPSSKLNQLNNNQLSRSGSDNGGFKIPQLGKPPKSDEDANKTSLTPLELTLKKIKEAKHGKKDDSGGISEKFKKLSVEENERHKDENWVVDLTKALSGVTVSNVEMPSRSEKKEETFPIPFIDCDRKTSLHDPDVDNVSEIVEHNSVILKKSSSKFGKIICLKYRCKKVPYIKHAFNPKHSLVHFKFDLKSRDDIILGHLSKFNQNI